MFEPFPKLTRFSHDWTITEKIDGTNAQILITPPDASADWPREKLEQAAQFCLGSVHGFDIYAGSRKQMLTVKQDNYGFAKFVQQNAPQLISALGEGRHFGEWCGLGIQRNYGLPQKVFALFNTHRWAEADLPDRVTTVPVLETGYLDSPGGAADYALAELREKGSVFAPGFNNPEGVVMFHRPSQTAFKKTFDYDEQGKWAEKIEGRTA